MVALGATLRMLREVLGGRDLESAFDFLKTVFIRASGVKEHGIGRDVDVSEGSKPSVSTSISLIV